MVTERRNILISPTQFRISPIKNGDLRQTKKIKQEKMNESWDLPWQNWAFTIRNGKIHGKHIGTLANKTEAKTGCGFQNVIVFNDT
jgi:hypothetical protein